jgi:hypothetical protein
MRPHIIYRISERIMMRRGGHRAKKDGHAATGTFLDSCIAFVCGTESAGVRYQRLLMHRFCMRHTGDASRLWH